MAGRACGSRQRPVHHGVTKILVKSMVQLVSPLCPSSSESPVPTRTDWGVDARPQEAERESRAVMLVVAVEMADALSKPPTTGGKRKPVGAGRSSRSTSDSLSCIVGAQAHPR